MQDLTPWIRPDPMDFPSLPREVTW